MKKNIPLGTLLIFLGFMIVPSMIYSGIFISLVGHDSNFNIYILCLLPPILIIISTTIVAIGIAYMHACNIKEVTT